MLLNNIMSGGKLAIPIAVGLIAVAGRIAVAGIQSKAKVKATEISTLGKTVSSIFSRRKKSNTNRRGNNPNPKSKSNSKPKSKSKSTSKSKSNSRSKNDSGEALKNFQKVWEQVQSSQPRERTNVSQSKPKSNSKSKPKKTGKTKSLSLWERRGKSSKTPLINVKKRRPSIRSRL